MIDVRKYASDPMAFIADLIIPSAHGPRRFGDVMAPFQRDRFQAIAPTLLAIVRGEKPPLGRFWWEGTKGTSKDGDCAACLLYLLAFANRPLDCQVGAADQDQADELRKETRDILHLTHWLAERVTIQNRRILCHATGASCEIIAADTAGSHGARPDVLILNELSHVTKREFAENLMDNAAKVPHGLVIVATNAGFIGTWQRDWRDLAEQSDRWAFHVWDKPAPWLDPAEIEEAKRRNSSSRYLRLWWGVWATGNGDALDPDDIAGCTNASAVPMYGDEPGFGFVAGLDLGISHDKSALCTLGVQPAEQRLKLAACEVWAPDPSGKVNLPQVKAGVLQAKWQFPNLIVFYDPHQAEFMAEQLRREGVPMFPMYFVGKNLDIMAAAVLQVFRDRMIELYPDAELLRDLGRLMIVEKSYGFKLEAARDKTGHADLGTAFAIAVASAAQAICQWQPPADDDLDQYFADLMRDYY
jgi:hypothetical protein